MSSIYSQLTKEELKIEKQQPALLSTDRLGEYRLTGIKAAIVGAFILSLAALAGAGYLYQRLNSIERDRKALEAVSADIRARADIAQTKAQELEAMTAQYREEIDELKSQLKAGSKERADLKIALEKSKSDLGVLQKKMNDFEARSRAIEDETSLIQTSAVSGLAVADAGKKGAEAVAKTFQVLTVNRKFNFVVVNMGLKDKVKIGDTLHVERGGKKIGKVQVEKIYENFAAATIAEEPKNAPIKEGDFVSKK